MYPRALPPTEQGTFFAIFLLTCPTGCCGADSGGDLADAMIKSGKISLYMNEGAPCGAECVTARKNSMKNSTPMLSFFLINLSFASSTCRFQIVKLSDMSYFFRLIDYSIIDFFVQQSEGTRYNLDIMTGGGMPFAPGAHPEYEAFYNGLSGFDKEAFKRFRRSHPTLTNQDAMSMFKLNHGHSRHMGMSHGL